jgi:hypothetical protein
MSRSQLVLLTLTLGVLLAACPSTRGRGGGGGEEDDDDSAAVDDDDVVTDDDDVVTDDDDVVTDDDDVVTDDDDVVTDDDDDAVQVAQPGDVLVTELMLDPTAVYDADGEWVELRNMTSAPIDISGWELADTGPDSVLVSFGTPLSIPANDYLLLGKSTSTSVNGGAPVAWAYGSDFTLANSGDEVILYRDDGQLMFSLSYAGSWAVEPGISYQLNPTVTDLSGAQNKGNWCVAWSAASYGLGDYGTPGLANVYCAD